ncbi:acetylornithine deacetylase [Pseudochelatococcus lubricantis]|uniref:Acetylornithine deacetylase n=1 Tax=Pseudochelatococcus lubricantis TaxID=1538102 RepID=A0ABX0UYL4_9HYPH|nr:acetylornithine deacetylase [Pseudochelatococcus lubricantis]NIJ57998.1 acetylornithine deacetylase [Pseudochelatococcus lubricantis]
MQASAILSDLVGFPSVCGTPNGPIVDYVRGYLAFHGIPSQIVSGPEGDRFNLFATIGPADQPGYILSGHMDVVSAEGQAWSTDPFRLSLDNGRYFGRGATDMKGFLACVLATVPEYAAMDLARPVHIAFSYDEESGCRGVKHLLRSLGPLCHPPAGCIVGEPSDMRPVLSHKGKISLALSFQGRAGHSSNPAQGENAIYPAAELIGFVRAQADRLAQEGPFDATFEPAFSTMQVGTVLGGTAVNIIPDRCVVELEIRAIPGHDPVQAGATVLAFADSLAEAAHARGGTLQIRHEETSSYPPLAPNPDPALAELLTRLTGLAPQQSVSYGTEAGLYQQAGIPAIICGPGSITRAHRANEYILDSELDACTAMLRGLGIHLQRH